MTDFTELTATKQLKELAREPFDLRGGLTLQRLTKYVAKGCGFQLFYGTERINDQVLKTLKELAEETSLLEKMDSLQKGAHCNTSEDRAVLHTATRDFFGEPKTPQAEMAKQEANRLKEFAEEIGEEFTDIVMVAIGGSDLGPRAHYIALEHLAKRRVHFISNVDPDDAADQLKGLDFKKTLVIVVSKSGTTQETNTNEALVRKQFVQAGIDPKSCFISVTAEGSPMDDKTRYLACFHMWDWVGGRFSTSSMGGGVMLALSIGFETYWELLRGAHEMDELALCKDIQQNLPLLGALIQIWNHNFLGFPTVALVPYSQALHRYAAHIQQVEMESNGKGGQALPFQTGPIIWGEPGTNAQHSFFQLIHQGTATVPLEFIGFKKSQQGLSADSQEKLLANLFAQSIALAQGEGSEFPGNRPNHILFGEKLTPYALGALLAYYEHKVAFQGFIWGINSFDQEGVQLGKRLANTILEGKSPLGDAFLSQI